MSKEINSYSICNPNDWERIPRIPSGVKTLFIAFTDSVLPPVPEGIVKLYCGGIRLKRLTSLPSTLTLLSCHYNELESLPKLPDGLEILKCTSNRLSCLPNLPVSLKQLQCEDCGVKALPELQHTSLWLLSVSRNRLKSIPRLPESIKDIYCEDNMLTRITTLPGNVRKLIMNNNKLNRLGKLEYKDNPLLPIYYRDEGKTLLRSEKEIYEKLNDLSRIIILKEMLTKLNRVYLDNKIRVFQRFWKDYWYTPFTLDGYDYPVSRYMIHHFKGLVCCTNNN